MSHCSQDRPAPLGGHSGSAHFYYGLFMGGGGLKFAPRPRFPHLVEGVRRTAAPGGVRCEGSRRGRTTVAWFSSAGPLRSRTGASLRWVGCGVKRPPFACCQKQTNKRTRARAQINKKPRPQMSRSAGCVGWANGVNSARFPGAPASHQLGKLAGR